MNPYRQFVRSFAHLIHGGNSLPLGGIPPHGRANPKAQNPVVLVFSPHPDDECIIGGLPLRLMRESGKRVINVPVTLGSNKERQAARRRELENACDWLGFGLEQTGPNGLQKISPKTRSDDAAHWTAAVEVITDLILKHQPRAVFFPHELDWNSAHIGTHFLLMDALKTLPREFHTVVVETEFWGQMQSPNLMVESSAEDLAHLLAALSFHVEEMRRNPYHLRLPAWMIDNVRRGAELVGGQGSAAPNFMFATLYRARQWRNGGVEELYPGGRQISVGNFVGDAFGWPKP